MQFKDFLFHRKMKHQLEVGHEVNITEFAALLGANQGDVSHWLNGTREPRNAETIKKLANNPIVGPGIYSALGIIRLEDRFLDRIISNLEQLPPMLQEHYAAEIEKAAQTQTQPQTKGGSAEQFAYQAI